MVLQKAVEGRNYTSGRWLGSASEQTFERRNPANVDEVIGVFPRSNADDVAAAVAAARQAYPAWRRMSRIRRGEILDTFVQLIKADSEELAILVSRESGKVINEARADIIEGIHMVQYEFGLARMPYGDVVASEVADKDSYIIRKPKGVVGVISPWNFPFAIPLWLIAPSLLEGNTVVFKPAEETPLIGQRIVEYFYRAGLPEGVLNLVHGYGEEAGWPLVTHPDVDVVLFTGSYEVGSKIKQAAAADPHKMAVCEMGGKNAIIIFDDADLDLAVNAAILSAFKTTGQRCVSASRLIVHERVIDEFADRFVAMARRIRIGDPLDPSVFMGPLVNEAATRKVASYNDLARQEGAEVLLDGGRLDGDGYSRGYFFSPFIYRMAHRPEARVLHEEVFGPHVAIIPFQDIEEAIAIHNSTEYGLAMSVITEDYRKARYIQRECDYGVGYWNLPSIGAEVHLPFGGVKKSGTGIPSAAGIVEAVTHKTTWTVNHSREIVMAQGLSARID